MQIRNSSPDSVKPWLQDIVRWLPWERLVDDREPCIGGSKPLQPENRNMLKYRIHQTISKQYTIYSFILDQRTGMIANIYFSLRLKMFLPII